MPIASNGTARIGWTEHGSGDATVLLIMGFGFGQRMWHRVIPALTDRYRVLTFDNRGVGESIGNEAPFTIGDLADDALAVADAAGAGEVHVFGVSMGGLTAQQVALTAPDRVRSLILGCTGTPSPDDQPKRGSRIKLRIPRWVVAPIAARSSCGPGVSRQKVREDTRILRSTPVAQHGLTHQGEAIAGFSSRDRLGTITAPTLVLHGDRDRAVPIERGRDLAERIPGARFEILPGSGHNFATDNTELANHLVREFLDQVEASRRPASR